MALSRRTGQRFQASIWPGFVDAMTGLLLVLMFVLTIFMVVQFVLRETITGQESELNTLSAEIAAIAEALGMERDKVETLETELGTLSATLDDTQSEVAAQSQLIAQLTQQRDDTVDQLAQASQRIASFEEQVASLLAAQNNSNQQITTLEAEKVELLSQQEQLNLALATARSEIDSAAEDARRKAAEREALDAYIASLEASKAENETRIAQQSDNLVKLKDLLSEEEAARLVSSQVAQELRKQLENATAELTAMTLVLEEQRRKAEETLIILAAAEAAKSDLDQMLQETLLALEAANLKVDSQSREISDLATTGQQVKAAFDQSEVALAAALARQQGLETQISELQAALKIALGSDEEKAALLSALQAQLSQNKDQLATLNQARQSAQSLAEKLQLQLSGALEDIERLNQDRLEKSDQSLALQNRLAQTREDLRQAEEAAADGQKKNATLEQKIAALLLSLNQAEAQSAEINDQLKDTQAELSNEQSALSDTQAALRNEQAARAKAMSEAEALNQKLAQALVNLTAADADRNRAATDIEQLQEALRKLEQTSSDAQRSLEADLASAVADKLAIDKQRSDTQAQLVQALNALSAAEQARESAADEAVRLETQLATQKQTSGEARRSLEADLAAALAAKLDAETDRKKVQDQLQQALAAQLAADQLSQTRLNESVERQILLQNAKEQLAEKSTALDKRTKDLLKAEKQSALLNQQVSELRKQLGQLQALLEASEELDTSNKVQLQNLGNRLNAALARAASEQRKRLKLEEAARKKLEEERNSLASQAEELAKYKSEFFGRLREVLAAEEGVRVVGDRFVFSSEVLFQPAQARLSGKGEAEITKVGRVLQRVMADIPDGIDWVIRVDGHTDNLPLSGTGRYKDNWELSQARALSVVKFMISQLQIPASRLAANGFGQFQPVNLANTIQARAQNRRIEIKLTER